jgi:hypothetical protein
VVPSDIVKTQGYDWRRVQRECFPACRRGKLRISGDDVQAHSAGGLLPFCYYYSRHSHAAFAKRDSLVITCLCFYAHYQIEWMLLAAILLGTTVRFVIGGGGHPDC